MKRLVLAALVAAGPAMAQSTGGSNWQTKGTAELTLLDKIRAQPSTVDVKVGGATNFGTLTIRVRSCAARPPDMPADSAAFVEISDSRAKGSAFKGWILANTPAVSQFEDPIYDVRLAACR